MRSYVLHFVLCMAALGTPTVHTEDKYAQRAAEKKWRAAYAAGLDQYGAEDANVLTMMSRPGELYLAMRESQPAHDVLTECLRRRQNVFGIRSPDVGLTLTHLATATAGMGEHVKAAKLFARALTVLDTGDADRRPHLALTLVSTGAFYAARREWQSAIHHFERGLRLQVAIYGEDHPVVLDTMWALSRALSKGKRQKEARVYQERVAALRTEVQAGALARAQTVDVRSLRAGR